MYIILTEIFAVVWDVPEGTRQRTFLRCVDFLWRAGDAKIVYYINLIIFLILGYFELL